MPSPFPGMNPYLEQEQWWPDFHQTLIPFMRDVLARQVRPGYVVNVETSIYLHEPPAAERLLLGRPDAILVRGGSVQARQSGGVTTAPVHGRVPLAVDTELDSYLHIRDGRSREVVTVIELLSPSNKTPGADREQYLAKRRACLRGDAHFVEIDLLRGGPRMPMEGLPACDYVALVSRAGRRPDVELFPAGLRDRLPIVPIPLRAPDPDAALDLQAVLHQVYDSAGYDDYIYGGSPQPHLRPEDEAWAAELVRRPRR